QGAMADRPCPSQKVQEYCMYFKLLQRTFGEKVPPAAADAFNQCFLKSAALLLSSQNRHISQTKRKHWRCML
ncbi:MAG: hypothetical protein LUE91_06190, partial [Oscillospiraceae bacterium]|nr:hypothetical protein [Oscillospiraceae bacterium]